MKNQNFLNQCDARLRRIFYEVNKRTTVEILPSTIRTIEHQKYLVEMGVSKTMNSLHLIDEQHPFSRAVDAGPWPIIWPDKRNPKYVYTIGQFYYFAGVVLEVAHELLIPIRYGGDWDGDFNVTNQTFYDLVHFELKE